MNELLLNSLSPRPDYQQAPGRGGVFTFIVRIKCECPECQAFAPRPELVFAWAKRVSPKFPELLLTHSFGLN